MKLGDVVKRLRYLERNWLLIVADGDGRKTRWRFRATRAMAERLLVLLTSSGRWRAGVLRRMVQPLGSGEYAGVRRDD